jgi:hypothetical protein
MIWVRESKGHNKSLEGPLDFGCVFWTFTVFVVVRFIPQLNNAKATKKGQEAQGGPNPPIRRDGAPQAKG